MGYTLAEIQGNCPFGRVGWVSYTATLDDGRFAAAGCWVNGDYSICPGLHGDGTTPRSLDGSGVYSGYDAVETAAYDLSDWADFTPGLDADPAAVAEVRGTIIDPLITAAVADALAAGGADNDPVYYGVSLSLTSPGVMAAGDTATMVLTVLGGDGNPTSRYDPVVWTSSDPAVATVDSSGTVTAVTTGTATITATTGSAAAPAPALTASGSVTVS